MFKKYIFRRKNIFSENTHSKNRKETEKIVSQNLKVRHFYFFCSSFTLSLYFSGTDRKMDGDRDRYCGKVHFKMRQTSLFDFPPELPSSESWKYKPCCDN